MNRCIHRAAALMTLGVTLALPISAASRIDPVTRGDRCVTITPGVLAPSFDDIEHAHILIMADDVEAVNAMIEADRLTTLQDGLVVVVERTIDSYVQIRREDMWIRPWVHRTGLLCDTPARTLHPSMKHEGTDTR